MTTPTRDPVWLPLAGYLLGAVALFLLAAVVIRGAALTLLDLAARLP